MPAVAVNAFRRYAKVSFSDKNLLYTNTGISVVMSFVGDGIQQNLQIRRKEIPGWNKCRSRDVTLFGFIIGPTCHYWYLMLDKWLPGRSFRTVAKKLIVDQCVCSPIVIGSFLFLTSFLEGKNKDEIRDEVIHKGITLYKAEWLVWPPAQTFQFFLLPTRYRVLFDNTVSFFFDWYYSYVKYGTYDKERKARNVEGQQTINCSDLSCGEIQSEGLVNSDTKTVGKDNTLHKTQNVQCSDKF